MLCYTGFAIELTVTDVDTKLTCTMVYCSIDESLAWETGMGGEF
jgi:hypothetical protein